MADVVIGGQAADVQFLPCAPLAPRADEVQLLAPSVDDLARSGQLYIEATAETYSDAPPWLSQPGQAITPPSTGAEVRFGGGPPANFRPGEGGVRLYVDAAHLPAAAPLGAWPPEAAEDSESASLHQQRTLRHQQSFGGSAAGSEFFESVGLAPLHPLKGSADGERPCPTNPGGGGALIRGAVAEGPTTRGDRNG